MVQKSSTFHGEFIPDALRISDFSSQTPSSSAANAKLCPTLLHSLVCDVQAHAVHRAFKACISAVWFVQPQLAAAQSPADLLAKYQPTPSPTPYACDTCKRNKDMMLTGIALGLTALFGCFIAVLKCNSRQRSVVANI